MLTAAKVPGRHEAESRKDPGLGVRHPARDHHHGASASTGQGQQLWAGCGYYLSCLGVRPSCRRRRGFTARSGKNHEFDGIRGDECLCRLRLCKGIVPAKAVVELKSERHWFANKLRAWACPWRISYKAVIHYSTEAIQPASERDGTPGPFSHSTPLSSARGHTAPAARW